MLQSALCVDPLLLAFVLSRSELSFPALDSAVLDLPTPMKALAQLGLPLVILANARPELPLTVLDFGCLGSSLLSKGLACSGLTLPICGLSTPETSVLVLGRITSRCSSAGSQLCLAQNPQHQHLPMSGAELSLLLQGLHCLDTPVLLFDSWMLDLLLFVLDPVSLGLLLSPRSLL